MPQGKLISVNVGRPRIVLWKGTQVSTGIFKSAVEGPVELKRLNLDGDRQADLSVHGGPYKAVYGYPAEEAAAISIATCAAHAGEVTEIRFVLFGAEMCRVWLDAASAYRRK